MSNHLKSPDHKPLFRKTWNIWLLMKTEVQGFQKCPCSSFYRSHCWAILPALPHALGSFLHLYSVVHVTTSLHPDKPSFRKTELKKNQRSSKEERSARRWVEGLGPGDSHHQQSCTTSLPAALVAVKSGKKKGSNNSANNVRLYAKHRSHLCCSSESQQTQERPHYNKKKQKTKKTNRGSWCRGPWGEIALHSCDAQEDCTKVS